MHIALVDGEAADIVPDLIGLPEPQVQCVLCVGTSDKDTGMLEMTQEEALELTRDIPTRELGGYTIQEAYRGWMNDGSIPWSFISATRRRKRCIRRRKNCARPSIRPPS